MDSNKINESISNIDKFNTIVENKHKQETHEQTNDKNISKTIILLGSVIGAFLLLLKK